MPPTGKSAEVDRVPRIDQEHIQDGAVVADAVHAPGIRHRLLGILLGVEDGDALEHGIGMQKEERLSVRLVATLNGQEMPPRY